MVIMGLMSVELLEPISTTYKLLVSLLSPRFYLLATHYVSILELVEN